MTRAILGALLAVATTATLLTNQGCKSTGVGDPCTPEQEYDPLFSGFSEKEVNVESKSFQCQTRLCLVNHFRGRVSCPAGQDSQGTGLAPTAADAGSDTAPCVIPGSDTPVAPGRPDPLGNCVAAQCADRTADQAVYCSCRCANVDGNTDDGSVYCGCPENFTCTQIVSSIGGSNEGLTGGYCIKNGTEYQTNSACIGASTTCVQ